MQGQQGALLVDLVSDIGSDLFRGVGDECEACRPRFAGLDDELVPISFKPLYRLLLLGQLLLVGGTVPRLARPEGSI